MMTAPATLPGVQVDCFALLDLPRHFALDLGEVERRYLDRSRAVHPDRTIGQPSDERVRSTAAAMDLNRAYRILKRPASRAEHLLALEGVTIGDNESVDPTLLAEVLDLREELAEARAGGVRAELVRLETAMRDRERLEIDRIAAAFARAEAAHGDVRQGALADAKAACLSLRYVARYLAAIDDAEAGD